MLSTLDISLNHMVSILLKDHIQITGILNRSFILVN